MLDTRTKIVTGERLAGRTVVAAYFDPMAFSHTQRFQELAAQHGPLAVCLCDPPDPLLPAEARAQLVAACRDVELVVIGEANLSQAAQIIDERAADLTRRAELMEHVYSRQDA